MIKQNKQFFLRFLLLTIIVSLVYTNLFPRILLNKGGCPYESETCAGESSILGDIAGISSISSTTISTLIIDGAGNFLNSHSAALIFLNKIEMSEVAELNYTHLRDTLYQAIMNMELAHDTYTVLVEIAAVTPYKQSIIERLKGLDYESFQTRYDLNSTTFKKVEKYLRKGDVTGLFGKVLTDSENILAMLYALKETVDKDRLPFNQDLWKLAQAYSEFHMFGQYAAQVFYEVTDAVE